MVRSQGHDETKDGQNTLWEFRRLCDALKHHGQKWNFTANVHCVSKKTSPTFLAITRESIDGFFIIFGRNVTEKASSHMLLYFSTSPN